MSRRDRRAQEAAERASEAGRILQAQKTEAEPTETKVEAPRPPSRNEPRRQAEAEIEAKQLERMGASEPKPEEVVPENPPPPTPEQMLEGGKFSQSEPTPEPAAEPTPEPTPEAVAETVKVKVDGEEFEVPKSEVEDAGGVKSYQIQRAAENRLKKANDAVAEARKMQDAIAQMAIQQFQQRNPQTPEITNDQFIAQKLEAIRFGTPEEGSHALNEILTRVVPKIDQDAVIQQATQRAMLQMRRQSGVDKFKDEFSDVVTNPHLLRLSVMLENERLQQVQPQALASFDWHEFYRKIGNEVRSIVRPNQPAAAAQTNGTTSQASEKEARKASIVALPTAAARAEMPREAKPETREDILNEARKARGLPTG